MRLDVAHSSYQSVTGAPCSACCIVAYTTAGPSIVQLVTPLLWSFRSGALAACYHATGCEVRPERCLCPTTNLAQRSPPTAVQLCLAWALTDIGQCAVFKKSLPPTLSVLSPMLCTFRASPSWMISSPLPYSRSARSASPATSAAYARSTASCGGCAFANCVGAS